MRKSLLKFAGVVIATLGLVISGASISSATVFPTATEFANPTDEQILLLDEDAPKVAEIDPSTGEIISIRLDVGGVNTAAVNTSCYSGNACWSPSSIVYPLYGFSGYGTNNGTWTNRGNFHTGSYNAKICWLYQGSNACTAGTLPKNTTSVMGAVVTGKSVTLS